MTYYFARTIDTPFDQAVAAVREALAQEGFGIITEVDVRQTMKAKIGWGLSVPNGRNESEGEREHQCARFARGES